ncbi:MAG: GFA family protein [Alphaproteobacteria bacterium]|nr:GFA family protein [Alphaproteobacteria bacterium]
MDQNDRSQSMTQGGACYCGAVEVTISGPPATSGYCHCHSCRTWHATPMTAFSIWADTAISIQGETIVTEVSGDSHRVSCKKCGGAVANKKPKIAMTVVYPMIYRQSGADFPPQYHLFYSERTMDISDGLPKFVNTPTDFGGSGERVDESKSTGWRMQV